MSNIFENKGAFATTIVVAASNSLNQAAANYVCDGAADDVEINAALAALPAARGRVVLLEGTYTTIANITIPANATLEGQGKATIVVPTGAAITNGIVLNGDNITLKNMKVILAAGAGAPGTRPNVVYADTRTLLWLENLWLIGDTSVADDGSDNRQCGIQFATVTVSKVITCRVEDNVRQGIILRGTSINNIISGSTFQGNTRAGIRNVSSDNILSGNDCCGNETGILLTSQNNSTVTGNFCQGNTLYGILVGGTNNTITANTCQGNTRHGIFVDSSSRNTITGNTCADNDSGGNAYSGIYVSSSNQNVICGNQCDGNGLHGIYLFRSSYCTVVGNVCVNQNTGDGINVTGDATTNADYNTVTGNACTGNASDGVEIAGGVDANKNIVAACQLLGNGGLALNDAGTLTEIAHNITV